MSATELLPHVAAVLLGVMIVILARLLVRRY